MSKTIKIKQQYEWRFDSGIVGFIKILEYAGVEINIKQDYIYFDESIFDTFSDMYFKYFADKYQEYQEFNKIRYNILLKYLQNESIFGSKIKDKDLKQMFEEDYILNIKKHLSLVKKSKYKCLVCKSSIKDITNNINVVKNTGFDRNRKTSNVWDFNNDIMLCPVCKLMYICIPAGFTNTKSKGVFINRNFSISEMIEINTRLEKHIEGLENKRNSEISKYLIDNIEQFKDCEIIISDENTFKIYFVKKFVVEKLINNKTLFNESVGYIDDAGKYHFIIDELLDLIFNNQNLFNYIHFLLERNLKQQDKCMYNPRNVSMIIKLNQELFT